MDERFDEAYDIERRRRRAQRLEEMRRRKRQQERVRRLMKIGIPVIVLAVASAVAIGGRGGGSAAQPGETVESREKAVQETRTGSEEEAGIQTANVQGTGSETGTANTTLAMERENAAAENRGSGEANMPQEEQPPYMASATAATRQLGGDIVSSYAVLIDTESDSIVAQKGAFERINPASMTKVLTLLVAAEQIEEEDLDDTFTITVEITDYSFVNGCSNVGFEKEETVTVRDLMYGTILPSGADAALGLATYTAGSQEAFVELMNDKLEELGLSETAHFTNCIGLYEEDHYCTPYDMAMILEAAVDNELCKEVLSAHTYQTSATEQHPEGLLISNWFLRRIEDKETGGEVLCGKTGYVDESGSCAASYGVDEDGKGYICVTANAGSSWLCIADHVVLYQKFMA